MQAFENSERYTYGLKVGITFDGKIYRLFVRNSNEFNDVVIIARSKSYETLKATFKSIRRNHFKQHRTIYFVA